MKQQGQYGTFCAMNHNGIDHCSNLSSLPGSWHLLIDGFCWQKQNTDNLLSWKFAENQIGKNTAHTCVQSHAKQKDHK